MKVKEICKKIKEWWIQFVKDHIVDDFEEAYNLILKLEIIEEK